MSTAKAVAEPELACFLNELPGEPPTGCSRLYYGAEFCFWRLPPGASIVAARNWARAAGCHFTLTTPVLAEEERRRFEALMKTVLPELAAGDEVLISDWGALEVVRSLRADLTIILGRVLSGQKRGPRILDMTLGPAQRDYFQRGSWHSREALALLAEEGIGRVEQDNLLQGLAPLPEGLKGSLHIPYAMVTSSRNCPFRADGRLGPCPVHCGAAFTLRTSETPVLLYQDGNSQFLCNEQVPGNLAQLGIDRIVRHPRLAV